MIGRQEISRIAEEGSEEHYIITASALCLQGAPPHVGELLKGFEEP